MVSYLLPKTINVSVAPGFIKRQGPNGSFLKKTGNLSFNVVSQPTGNRLFVEGTTTHEENTALSYLYRLSIGLSRGFRRRLRLVGIGFRAVKRRTPIEYIINKKKTTFKLKKEQEVNPFFSKNYRVKRIKNSKRNTQIEGLVLKVGFSHEYTYPIASTINTKINTSRLEGRSKGTIVRIQGADLTTVNTIASEIRAFRIPDCYKGKGIHYDQEVLNLKKGKRQN